MSICTTPATAGERIGKPCDDCGHTNLVHPGTHNPALDACLLCQLSDHEATLRVRAAG